MASAAESTAIYAINVSTVSSLQAGSGINEIYLPATDIVVIAISPINKILHRNRTNLYVISYAGFILSTVLKKSDISTSILSTNLP